MDKYREVHDTDKTIPPETKAERKERKKRAKAAMKERLEGASS
jgi:hypothetical protein